MRLSSTWFTEPAFDFELKKYQLLAYLQQKQKELQEQKIYPHLDELTLHETTLENFLKQKNEMDHHFKKELKGIDEKTLELKYAPIENGDEHMGEFINIVNYSFKKMKNCRIHFEEEMEELQRLIRVELTGLIPSWLREGFLIIYRKTNTGLFYYEAGNILNSRGDFEFQFRFLQDYPAGYFSSFSSIKSDIKTKFSNELNIPAVFSVITETDLPVYETVLPITSFHLRKWVA